MKDIVLILFVIAVTWVTSAFALWWIAQTSGWKQLAREYPEKGERPPLGKLGSCVFRRWLGYNNGIIVGTDTAGLHLWTIPVLMSWCHDPIEIPWSEIEEVRARPALTWGKDYLVHLRRAPGLDFALRNKTFERVRRAFEAAGVRVVD